MSVLAMRDLWNGSDEWGRQATPAQASQVARPSGGNRFWDADGYAMRLVRHSQSGRRKVTERRSRSSRFYRAVIRPRFLVRVVICAFASWSLVLAATPLPPDAEAAVYWRVFVAVLGTVTGLLALFAAGLAFGARWVAKPVAAAAIVAHAKEGAAAHPSLVARDEWDRKHGELVGQVNELAREIAALTGELRKTKRMDKP